MATKTKSLVTQFVQVKNDMEYYISLGIEDIDPESTVTSSITGRVGSIEGEFNELSGKGSNIKGTSRTIETTVQVAFSQETGAITVSGTMMDPDHQPIAPFSAYTHVTFIKKIYYI